MTDLTGNREHSAIFTPMDVAHRMAAQFAEAEILRHDWTCLDPACGSGNLLEAVCARRLALGVPPEVIAAGIHGYDIQPDYVMMCRERLAALLGGSPKVVAALECNIVVKDFLQETGLFY